MARDSAWETARSPQFVDDRYAYFFTFRTANSAQTESLIERAPLSGNGALDPGWQRTIPASMDMVSAHTDDQGNFFAHINAGFRIQTPSAIYTDQNITPTTQTVVEFYSSVANRYFITGRPADHAVLDQYPAIFQRTGMRFETQSATFLDTWPGPSERFQPTCRFYFGPARGGSNSHFLAPVKTAQSSTRSKVSPTKALTLGHCGRPMECVPLPTRWASRGCLTIMYPLTRAITATLSVHGSLTR